MTEEKLERKVYIGTTPGETKVHKQNMYFIRSAEQKRY